VGGARSAYWQFDDGGFAPVDPCIGNTTELPAGEARLYKIESWRPPAHNTAYNVVEVDPNGRNNAQDGNNYYRWPYIPWNGAFGQNHQWLKRNTETGSGDWVAAGPGPQDPVEVPDLNPQSPTFGLSLAGCVGNTGNVMWLRKGSDLYVNLNQGFYTCTTDIAVSALRVTELNALPPNTCGPATYGGPVDLRCIGNTDPFYANGPSPWWDSTSGEPFVANSPAKTLASGDHTLAAEGYVMPCATTLRQANDPWPVPVPLSPGLPANGAYTAHLTTGDVAFKLRFAGLHSIQWDTGENNPLSPFLNNRVFTLNNTPDQEFLAGAYSKLYLLSTKNGGDNSQLNVELVYSDSSTETVSVGLYEWFNTDGDATAIAVGVNGNRRNNGANGFKRLRCNGTENGANINDNWNGFPDNGDNSGTTSGAFFFVHPIDVNVSKNLSRVNLSVAPDGRGFGGRINIVAASLVGKPCETPVFDVAGGGPNGDQPDAAVDMRDFAAFQLCYTGSHTNDFDGANCACFDITPKDQLIDEYDFGFFVACRTGPVPGNPPEPGCDQP